MATFHRMQATPFDAMAQPIDNQATENVPSTSNGVVRVIRDSIQASRNALVDNVVADTENEIAESVAADLAQAFNFIVEKLCLFIS